MVAPSERERIEAVYADYAAAGRGECLWDASAPGNREIFTERHELTTSLLDGFETPRAVLEIGCGGGAVMSELRGILGPEPMIVGVDLIGSRLVDAKGPDGFRVQADGRRLPFEDGTFDLVVTFTVFSSILDQQLQGQLAAEIERVLASNGAVLWYDMRYPSPNRQVRPLRRSHIAALFPDRDLNLEALTVLPPLARRLGNRSGARYGWLSKLPFLRSHLGGLLSPADAAVR